MKSIWIGHSGPALKLSGRDFRGFLLEVNSDIRGGWKLNITWTCCDSKRLPWWSWSRETWFRTRFGSRCGVTTEEAGATSSGDCAWLIVEQTPLFYSSCTVLDVGVSNLACNNYKISLHLLRCSFLATREVWKKAKGHHLCVQKRSPNSSSFQALPTFT